jgi:hypothetical protein
MPATHLEREHAAVEARWQARYEWLVALAGDGHSLRDVARRAWDNPATARPC